MEELKKKLEKKLNKDSFNFLKELVEKWQYSWEDIEEKVNIEIWEIVWNGDLNLRWTKVKRIKAKKIGWNLYAFWLKSLEEIVEEEIWWYLDVRRTKVKKVKAKRIEWNLYAYWAEYLEDIEVEEDILWYLDVRWTKVKRIKAKRIEWDLYTTWVEYLEDIEVEEEIWWDLYINRTSIDFQKKILKEIKKWELKVKWKVVFWGDFIN